MWKGALVSNWIPHATKTDTMYVHGVHHKVLYAVAMDCMSIQAFKGIIRRALTKLIGDVA